MFFQQMINHALFLFLIKCLSKIARKKEEQFDEIR
jgi:hypothetical protein